MLLYKGQNMSSCIAFGNNLKKIVIFLIFFVILFDIANSVVIEVEIPKSLEGNITYFSYDSSKDIVKFQFEFYNTGSTAYKARIRIDVMKNSKIIFTGWSDEKILMPGDRKNFEVYWYSNFTGNFTLRSRVYFGNEILERYFVVEKEASFSSEDVFEIKNFRSYDDFVVFDIKALRNTKNVVILPHDFPLGWIFEQKKIGFLKENEEKTIALKYKPTAWVESKLTLIIASDEGRYKTERTFEMKKEFGIIWLIHYITDKIKLFVREA